VTPQEKPLVAISSCLLGEKVRYDGNDSFSPAVVINLERELRLVSLCPEVAIGLGIPRSPIQLISQSDQIRVVGVEDGSQDFTEPLKNYAADIVDKYNLSGYVFKSRSPSCGLRSTPVYDLVEPSRPDPLLTSGIVAAAIIHMLPGLPVEDELSLQDFNVQRDFIVKVKRYQKMIRKKLKRNHDEQIIKENPRRA
jgi:uncharacterized protein YbbK (DUF523 family)